MARTIRDFGLKLASGLLRLFSQPERSGWRTSTRPSDLRRR